MVCEGLISVLFSLSPIGMVSCWHVDGKTRPTSTFSGTSQHNSEITILKWNPTGKRVITGDKVCLQADLKTTTHHLLFIEWNCQCLGG